MVPLNWEIQVVAGEHSLGEGEGHEQMFNVEAIIMHPQYNSQEKMDHDVAILKLNGKLQF